MNHIPIIIQARMSSTRLPGKAMISLDGDTCISYMIKTCKKVAHELGTHVTLITTNNSEDDIFELFYNDELKIIRGSTDNVMQRIVDACSQHDDFVLRVTGDCPLLPEDLLEEFYTYSVKRLELHKPHLITNCFNRTYPRGFDMEVLNVRYLKELLSMNLEAYHYEHVVSFIEENHEKHEIIEYTSEENFSEFRLTLDEPLDAIFISKIIGYIKKSSHKITTDVIYNSLKKIKPINSLVKHKNYDE